MKFSHPYSKYGLAITMQRYDIDSISDITNEMLIKQLKFGLLHFRLYPERFLEDNTIQFGFLSLDKYEKNPQLIQSTGLAAKGNFLSPTAITRAKSAKQLWQAQQKLISSLKDGENLDSSVTVTMSIAPVTSKINNGKISQASPKSTLFEASCCAITNTTPLKPVITQELKPVCIIPDLSIKHLKSFISLFERMLISQGSNKLFYAKRKISESNDKTEEKIPRPAIFHGNFPYAPHSFAFGAVGLLGAIGRWAREAQLVDWAKEVLDSLKNVPIYIISYEKVFSVSFNHYVVELAKEDRLCDIIRALEATKLHSEERKSFTNPAYNLFFMQASRFLQLFTKASFKDFLSFRAEYHPNLHVLLTNYFRNVEMIDQNLIRSARELGRWLNLAAYIAACNEVEEKQNFAEINKLKAKVLVELESTAFAAKNGPALISQVVTRAGRLTGMDAPPEAIAFMEATSGGGLHLDDAKNLLVAFSRVRNKKENKSRGDDLILPQDDEEISPDVSE